MKPEEYPRMAEAEGRQWWYVGMRAITAALLGREPGGGERPSLLDAGCGTGENLVRLGQRHATVGVDLAPAAVDFCRARGQRVVRGSVLSLPFRDGSFDRVTSFDVLYHRWVEDDAAAVRELVRVLRPGGVLLVRVPALKVLWGAHDAAVFSRHRYTAAELRALFVGAGLEGVRTTYANTLLFPLLLLRRWLDRRSGREGSDVGFLPAPLEWLFTRLLQAEAALVGAGLDLPIGASVFAVGRKPAATAARVESAP